MDKKCSLCDCETNDDEGCVDFFIGILPFTLCPFCWNGLAEAFECHEPCYHCGCETPHVEPEDS